MGFFWFCGYSFFIGKGRYRFFVVLVVRELVVFFFFSRRIGSYGVFLRSFWLEMYLLSWRGFWIEGGWGVESRVGFIFKGVFLGGVVGGIF